MFIKMSSRYYISYCVGIIVGVKMFIKEQKNVPKFSH